MKYLGFVGIFFAITACGNDTPASAPLRSKAAVLQAEARQHALATFDSVELPAWAPAVPPGGVCQDEVCEVNRVQFERVSWPSAWQGDLQAQRNTASCLTVGCFGAVVIDQTAGCAWRTVIIKTDGANASDARNLERECGALTDAQRKLAIQKSDQIIAQLAKRSKPL